MQMDTEARAWLDATVKRILARHPLGDAERMGITYELMSHLHAAGEARATAAGRDVVTRLDLEGALVEAGGEQGLAAAFVQPLARPLERAPLGRRFGALVIDGFVVILGLIALHTLIEVTLRALAGVLPDAPPSDLGPSWWLPWGYHDPTLAPIFRALYSVASAALILGYFAWSEAGDRRTLGKRAMEVRVVRTDGSPLTYRESILRNVTKLFPPLFALDVILGLIAFPKEKQRVSERIAGTLVVRA